MPNLSYAGLLLRCVIAATTVLGALAVLTVPPAWPLEPPAGPLRVSLVTIVRPGDDPTLVADAALGLRRAQADFAGRITTAWIPVQARSSDARAVWAERTPMRTALQQAAGTSDLVITWGDLFTDSAIAVAQEHPRVRFVLEDAIYLEHLPPNMIESTIWDGEQAFLAGVIAGLDTRSRRVGYLGPLQGWQENAFRAGAYYVSPGVRVVVDFLAVTITAQGGSADLPASWRIAGDAGTSEPGYREPRKAEEVALAQFDRGADVIYAPVGASVVGVYRAAMLRRHWVIGQGGPRSLTRLPEASRGRNLAMIVKREDVVVHHLVSRVLNRLPLRQHIVWSIWNPALRDPRLPTPVIGVTLNPETPSLIATAGPRLARIMDDVRDGLIGIPYSKEQLANFLKRYAR